MSAEENSALKDSHRATIGPTVQLLIHEGHARFFGPDYRGLLGALLRKSQEIRSCIKDSMY